jgi:fluoroacetyl-CoA thioesterase
MTDNDAGAGCGCAQSNMQPAAPVRTALASGLHATCKLDVDRDRTIGFMGEKARVYATPMLVRDIEVACRDLLLAHLEPGQDSVGTRIEIDHVAATLLGMHVELSVRVIEIKGRVVTLDVQGRDSVEEICRGRHVRFIVDRKTMEARLAAKAAKAGLAWAQGSPAIAKE